MSAGEDQLIGWLRRRLQRLGSDLLGDDAALLEERADWAISVDQQIEGVHFPPGLDPGVAGRRLVSVCLSDLAASGAEPAYGFLTVALPRRYDAKRLLTGVLTACRRYGVTLAGGDTASAPRGVSLTMTVLGRRRPRCRWLRRSHGRPGDGLWLGGPVGESALGRHLLAAGASFDGRSVTLPRRHRAPERWLRYGRRAVRRHLDPRPQLELGGTLARRRRVAAVDISDGLAIDLHRLCRESGVGADLEREAIPVSGGLEYWASALEIDPDQLMLAGGEDYVLLFTLPPRGRPADAASRRIGTLTERPGVRLGAGDEAVLLPPRGWDHLAKDRT